MRKPKIIVTIQRQLTDAFDSKASHEENGKQELFESFTTRSQRNRKSRGGAVAAMLNGQSSSKTKLLMPALLAIVTGVVLGMCLLVVFKGQASEPTVTTIPAPSKGQAATSDQKTAVAGAAEVGGESLYAWQVGAFQDKAAAEKAQSEFAQKGLQVVLRGTGPYQLFAGVAPDKAGGKALESELQKGKITYYAKEFKILPRQGVISGLQDQDAKGIADGLSAEMKLANDLLPLALTLTPEGDKLAALGKRVNDLNPSVKTWRSTLEAAGLKVEGGQLETMHSQLVQVVQELQTGKGLLDAQSKLAAFYVQYESLSLQLIKAQ